MLAKLTRLPVLCRGATYPMPSQFVSQYTCCYQWKKTREEEEEEEEEEEQRCSQQCISRVELTFLKILLLLAILLPMQEEERGSQQGTSRQVDWYISHADLICLPLRCCYQCKKKNGAHRREVCARRHPIYVL